MFYHRFGPSLVTQTVKNLPAMQETQVRSLGQEVPLEKEMATHSSILAYRIPRTEEPGKLKSTRLHRFGLLSNQKNLTPVSKREQAETEAPKYLEQWELKHREEKIWSGKSGLGWSHSEDAPGKMEPLDLMEEENVLHKWERMSLCVHSSLWLEGLVHDQVATFCFLRSQNLLQHSSPWIFPFPMNMFSFHLPWNHCGWVDELSFWLVPTSLLQALEASTCPSWEGIYRWCQKRCLKIYPLI